MGLGMRSLRASSWIASLVVATVCVTACTSTSGTSGTSGTSDRNTLANTDVVPAAPAVEPEAVEIVRGCAEHLRSAQTLAVSALSGFDVVQGDGQKIEFGSSWEATIQRPNRARMSSHRRDGVRTQIVFDGNDIWMYSPDHDVYASESQPGDIDASFHHLLDELGVSTPLSNLFSDEVGSRLGEGLTSCYVVGDSKIAGHDCHHIAARNDYADYQLWIDRGDVPALRRIVISYREEAGHPQYWAYFTKWDFAPKPAPGTFVFQPPAGAERIRMAHVGEGEE